jgi:catechol 2,3-dioxygenase-like lactoylglutathione lyase family enzyme
MKQNLTHIALVVDDYDKAIEFYTEKLHFDLIEDTALSDTKRWVLVRPKGLNECSLLLAKSANEEQISRIGNQTGLQLPSLPWGASTALEELLTEGRRPPIALRAHMNPAASTSSKSSRTSHTVAPTAPPAPMWERMAPLSPGGFSTGDPSDTGMTAHVEAPAMYRGTLSGRDEVRRRAIGAQRLSGTWAHVVGRLTSSTTTSRLPPLLGTSEMPTP